MEEEGDEETDSNIITRKIRIPREHLELLQIVGDRVFNFLLNFLI